MGVQSRMGDIRPIGLTPVRTLIAGDSGINRTLVRRVERESAPSNVTGPSSAGIWSRNSTNWPPSSVTRSNEDATGRRGVAAGRVVQEVGGCSTRKWPRRPWLGPPRPAPAELEEPELDEPELEPPALEPPALLEIVSTAGRAASRTASASASRSSAVGPAGSAISSRTTSQPSGAVSRAECRAHRS
jgi:hypothetical protein